MRSPALRVELGADDIVVDNFAGGGGTSEGVARALGRPVSIAVNHDPIAIAMYRANHPETRTYCQDIFAVKPREVCGSRRCRVAWFSPDCTHHSRAKGKKPRETGRRALANVVIDWAEEVRPDVIILENVEEFEDWGPLDERGYPIKARAGEDFRAWLARLVALGYRVEYRSLVAANYGTPTTRKRLFLIARCDGLPIVWPEPTHGRGCPNPWRPAAEVIDWAEPCPSIFLSAEEGRALGIRRPLADATLRRIAAGLWKYVMTAAEPFIVPVTHQGDQRVHSTLDPLRTVTGAHRGELALVAPTLIQTGYGERKGQAPRALDLQQPLGTVVAGGSKHALVAAFIAKHYGGGQRGRLTPGSPAQLPLGTVTARDHNAVVAAWLTKFYGTAGAGSGISMPVPTVLTGSDRGGGHIAKVAAFLTKYYSGGKSAAQAQQQSLFAPLHTVTTRDRFGLVEIYGDTYEIRDIGMRMLRPGELFRAQGFREDYDITCERVLGRPLTKTEQTSLAGNSVPPQLSEALVAANINGRWRAAA
jgi:DNA (cytosine-5)-methyltransferase 1